MADVKSPYRALKICCGVTAIFLIILIITCIILYFTILKPKPPIVTPLGVTLDYMNSKTIPAFPFLLFNVTLGVRLLIDNRNYASFKYSNSTSDVEYRGTHAAEAYIPQDYIPARSKHNVTVSVDIFGDDLVLIPGFWQDAMALVFNFTTDTSIQGTSTVLNLFKVHARTVTLCNVSVSISKETSTSVCSYALKY